MHYFGYKHKPYMYNKEYLDEVFVISRIIKVEVSVISLSLRLRLITLTETLIISDIIKTESNNCFVTWHISNILFIIREVNSDMPIYINRTIAGKNQMLRAGGFESRSGHLIFSSICSVYIDRHIRVDLSDDEQ